MSTRFDSAWSPQLVGMTASPFIRGPRVALLCPSCGAPLPVAAENDYRFSVCKYCKVVSADVSVDDIAASQPRGSGFTLDLASIGYGPLTVDSHASYVINVTAQIPFRPVAIWFDPEIAKNFMLKDFRVGVDSQFIHPNPIPGTVCAMGDGYVIPSMDPCVPGIMMTLEATNISNYRENIFGMIRGRTLERPSAVLSAGGRIVGHTIPRRFDQAKDLLDSGRLDVNTMRKYFNGRGY